MSLGRIGMSAPGKQRPEKGQRAAEYGDGKLTKVLMNVTVERSLGPIHVVMSPENTVADLIRAAVEAYVKEGRRPLLVLTDPKGFELHYSQYSLNSLDPEEKLIDLGSRNFFLCSKSSKISSCSSQQPNDAAVDIPSPP